MMRWNIEVAQRWTQLSYIYSLPIYESYHFTEFSVKDHLYLSNNSLISGYDLSLYFVCLQLN